MTSLDTPPTPLAVTVGQTGATAAASHAIAQIQGRALVAIARPRDTEAFRVKILKDCERPGFAEKARYNKPIGKGLVGMSIRFAESALRHYGNLYCDAITVDDNNDALTIRVSVTDLETNSCDSKDVTIHKTVERRKKPKAESLIVGTRFNSFGDELWILRATADECLGKINSEIAKAKRNLIISFLPFDIVEEAEKKIIATNRNADAADPDAAQKKLIDAFAALQITPSDLREFMGKPPSRFNPADLQELRGYYESLRDGETSWEEVLEIKKPVQTAGEVTNAAEVEVEVHTDPHLGDLASELDAADAEPKPKPKPGYKDDPEPDIPRPRGDVITDIESLGLNDAQITSAASDMTGQTVLDYLMLTDEQLVDLLSQLQKGN